MVNGITDYAVTKLDVLSGFDEIKVCTAYRYNGKTSSRFPSETETLERVEPVYETLPGWKEDITAVENVEDLPQAARLYGLHLEIGRRVAAEEFAAGQERADTSRGGCADISTLAHNTAPP